MFSKLSFKMFPKTVSLDVWKKTDYPLEEWINPTSNKEFSMASICIVTQIRE